MNHDRYENIEEFKKAEKTISLLLSNYYRQMSKIDKNLQQAYGVNRVMQAMSNQGPKYKKLMIDFNKSGAELDKLFTLPEDKERWENSCVLDLVEFFIEMNDIIKKNAASEHYALREEINNSTKQLIAIASRLNVTPYRPKSLGE